MGDFIEYQNTQRGADVYRRTRGYWKGSTPFFTILDEAFVEPPKPVPDRKTVIQGLLGVMVEMDDIRESRAA